MSGQDFGQSSSHDSCMLEEHRELRIFKQIVVNKLMLAKPSVCSHPQPIVLRSGLFV